MIGFFVILGIFWLWVMGFFIVGATKAKWRAPGQRVFWLFANPVSAWGLLILGILSAGLLYGSDLALDLAECDFNNGLGCERPGSWDSESLFRLQMGVWFFCILIAAPAAVILLIGEIATRIRRR